MAKWIKELITGIFKVFSRKKAWKDIEYFDQVWKIRIQTMAQFIEPNSIIMDLGCGKMWLKEHLYKTNIYLPVDYIKRDNETIVCDFNNQEFPTQKADITFVSGCLEYVNDYKWFVQKICLCSNKCIISYCITEKFPNIKNRENSYWVNNLSQSDLINLFVQNGFSLTDQIISKTKNYIYCFERNKCR